MATAATATRTIRTEIPARLARLPWSYGGRKLFMATLGIYLLATVATAFAFASWYGPPA